MFIRFVSSRRIKTNKRTKNNVNIYRLASVVMAIFIAASLITRIWELADKDDGVKEWFRDRAVSMYKELALNGYSIALYGNSVEDEGKAVMTQFIDVINGNNSLYGYMENENISVTFYENDPLYNYADVVMNTEGVSGEEDAPSDTGNNTGNDEDSQLVADTDNAEKDEEKSDDSDESNNETLSDYVVPAVSDAGVTYTMEQLSSFDFLMSKLYTVPSRARVYESDLVAEEMLKKDMTVQGDNSKPQILIYHTHSQEGFVDSVPGDDSTSIVAVGAYLAKILSEEYGYNVIHCQEHFDIASGKLDRSKAYTYAQYTIEQILEDNPSIDVILDIHRDGLKEGAAKLVTNINGKETAKIMFFNGVSRSSAAGDIDYLYNRYRADNLAFSFQLKLMAMECYPEFTRRNYIDAYQYNLHHRQKSVLIEVGAQNNTLQEELNAMEVLAEVLHRVISPENKEKEE